MASSLFEVAKLVILYRLIGLLVITGLSIYFFWLYGTHKGEYCKRNIALWLVVTGAISLGSIILEILTTIVCINNRIKNDEATEENLKVDASKRNLCMSPLYLFGFAWFIVGNVWVFKTKKNECDDLVYNTGFWYLITLYILVGAGMIIGCCVGCCTFLILKNKK